MDGVVTQEEPLLQRFADSSQFPLAMMAFGAFVAWAESLLMLVQGESIENAIWPQAVYVPYLGRLSFERTYSSLLSYLLFSWGFASTLPSNITEDIVSISQFKQSSSH